MTMTLGVKNMDAVKANLRQYDANVRKRAQAVVEGSADRVYETAQSLCPVDTGYMKAHMVKELSPHHFAYQVGFREEDFPESFYPFYQEYGTRFMPAQPCIHPAYDVESPRFMAELKEALRP